MSVAAADPLHKHMANALRALSMDAVQKANSGHPGMPMGMADVATVLWRHFLRFDPKAPQWPDRDRFILSAGHGSMLLYALAYLTGYEKIDLDQIKNFRQLGSHTPGHPERDLASGIETTTGPLGQGVANSVGFALAERILNARFGDELVDHRTFVIASDGDLMEGISHEAASLAGHLKLGRLIVYYDDNKISIDGSTALSFTENVQERFRAYGWHVLEVDGHDPDAIALATEAALAETTKPSLIACKTIIGYGAPNKQGSSGCHGSPLGADEIAAARGVLGWDAAPFEVPEHVFMAWRGVAKRGEKDRALWERRLDGAANKESFLATMWGDVPADALEALLALKKKVAAEKPKKATRQSSGDVLAALVPTVPSLIGGSADLSPSNNTQVKETSAISAPFFAGRYIHFGVREHGMAAAMNGMALHGGVIPYGGTFMQFADYCRPSIRLAALMKQRVVFVMTHDSIGLGEDGPTHQPVEHLAALRAIPHLMTFRPADGIETAECWQIALETKDAPSLLALSRQNLPTVREDASSENKSARGGYVLKEASGPRSVTLLATGSEVSLALEAQQALEKEGIAAAVVSIPCFALFDRQDKAYRKTVLGDAPRVAIEAGVRMGWDQYLGETGAFVGLSDFGASAPAEELYKHFGITVDALVAAAKSVIKS
ncbi:MAG: transketolase [Alphaproteobacteria bacterium]|jgi:transketolase|nr:transketolase [Alphaproteobacteria bacterium]